MRFPIHARFFDVEGMPVSIDAGNGSPFCACWDTDPPRPFDPASAYRNGTPIASKAFEKLVAQQSVRSPPRSAERLPGPPVQPVPSEVIPAPPAQFDWRRPNRSKFFIYDLSGHQLTNLVVSGLVWASGALIVLRLLQILCLWMQR